MSVEQICSHSLVTCTEGATVRHAVGLMAKHKVGCVVATRDDGSLAGILTDRDVALRVVGHDGVDSASSVHSVMTAAPGTVTAGTEVQFALTLVGMIPVLGFFVTVAACLIGLGAIFATLRELRVQA